MAGGSNTSTPTSASSERGGANNGASGGGSASSRNKSYTCCLLIFDASRGQKEGREEEALLCVLPATTAKAERLTLLGLCQGIITFASQWTTPSAGPSSPGEDRSPKSRLAETGFGAADFDDTANSRGDDARGGGDEGEGEGERESDRGQRDKGAEAVCETKPPPVPRVLHLEHHRLAFWSPEPDIFVVLQLPTAVFSVRECPDNGIMEVLQEACGLYNTLYGPIRPAQGKEGSREDVEYVGVFAFGKNWRGVFMMGQPLQRREKEREKKGYWVEVDSSEKERNRTP